MLNENHVNPDGVWDQNEQLFQVRLSVPRAGFLSARYAVPVLSATRLQLDFLLDVRPLDLQAIASVILGDVGATLQVFRVAAHGRARSVPRYHRVEDCLVDLGRIGVRGAVDQVFPAGRDNRLRADRKFWAQALLRAELSRSLGRRYTEINPSHAYLAGLLHDMGAFPLCSAGRFPESMLAIRR